MSAENSDLFYTLLKLKSYLISLVDDPNECENDFTYTSEYLDRKHPGEKEEIINLLIQNNIKGDCDIIFDEQIHLKFKDIASKTQKEIDLLKLLENLKIESEELIKEEAVESYKSQKEYDVKNILNSLLQLAKAWSAHKELNKNLDNYSVLDEESVIRPDEEIKLNNLDQNSDFSFRFISAQTIKYLEMYAEYFFRHGGDVFLNKFKEELDNLKNSISEKYEDFLKNHGIKPGSKE